MLYTDKKHRSFFAYLDSCENLSEFDIMKFFPSRFKGTVIRCVCDDVADIILNPDFAYGTCFMFICLQAIPKDSKKQYAIQTFYDWSTYVDSDTVRPENPIFDAAYLNDAEREAFESMILRHLVEVWIRLQPVDIEFKRRMHEIMINSRYDANQSTIHNAFEHTDTIEHAFKLNSVPTKLCLQYHEYFDQVKSCMNKLYQQMIDEFSMPYDMIFDGNTFIFLSGDSVNTRQYIRLIEHRPYGGTKISCDVFCVHDGLEHAEQLYGRFDTTLILRNRPSIRTFMIDHVNSPEFNARIVEYQNARALLSKKYDNTLRHVIRNLTGIVMNETNICTVSYAIGARLVHTYDRVRNRKFNVTGNLVQSEQVYYSDKQYFDQRPDKSIGSSFITSKSMQESLNAGKLTRAAAHAKYLVTYKAFMFADTLMTSTDGRNLASNVSIESKMSNPPLLACSLNKQYSEFLQHVQGTSLWEYVSALRKELKTNKINVWQEYDNAYEIAIFKKIEPFGLTREPIDAEQHTIERTYLKYQMQNVPTILDTKIKYSDIITEQIPEQGTKEYDDYVLSLAKHGTIEHTKHKKHDK